MELFSLLGSTMGLGFTSGLNLYATVLTIGLGVRLGLLRLSPELSHLEILSDPYILIAAGAIYVIEFCADKIPWVDSAWDVVHTFIRPVGAAILGLTAVGSLDPVTKIVVMLLCGGVALSGHSAKAGTRVAVNHSPEPFTNIGLSVFEDAVAVGGTWLSLTHPEVMLVAVLVFLAFFLWLSPKIFRLLRVEFAAVSSILNKHFGSRKTLYGAAGGGPNVALVAGTAGAADSHRRRLAPEMPGDYKDYWEKKFGHLESLHHVRCAAGKGVSGLRNSTGYLHVTDGGLVFVTRKLFRFRSLQVALDEVKEAQFKRGLLLDRLTWVAGGKRQTFLTFKDGANHAEQLLELLRRLGKDGRRAVE